MLFKGAKSVEVVMILGKQLPYPNILNFMQKQFSVATFAGINIPKKPIFPFISVNLALNMVIMVLWGAFLVKKRYFK